MQNPSVHSPAASLAAGALWPPIAVRSHTCLKVPSPRASIHNDDGGWSTATGTQSGTSTCCWSHCRSTCRMALLRALSAAVASARHASSVSTRFVC